MALGGDLDPETLILAYRNGIFPWPIEGLPLAWFCPPRRAILEFSSLHIPRSLARAKARSSFSFTMDIAFGEVIRACADCPRPGQPGTWITGEMLAAYSRLHELGFAHSVEVWDGTELAGGIYGVSVDGTFAGESMFFRKSPASKLALLHLIEFLQANGLTWMDIQVMTPHMRALGAKLISRDQFLKRLKQTRSLGLNLFRATAAPAAP
ncbi:MAG TPA: leucyl/phenylalanyl-tRNA--protein transferase [Bdellovibrionota bacterium]|nr:leucyl/phenylalanyl-tRNA--protein transferase [Bdellovibrionota bacterium]